MDPELRREIILDNYNNPQHKGEGTSNYIKVNTNNSSCIDNIDLWVLFEDNIIKDIKFDGEACAISTASTSIMIKELIGKSLDEALRFIDSFEKMIDEEKYNPELLNEANVFDEIYKQANRKTCATLPYKGIIKAIEEYKKRR